MQKLLTKPNLRELKLHSILYKVALATSKLTAALDPITNRKPNQVTSNETKDVNFIDPPVEVSY